MKIICILEIKNTFIRYTTCGKQVSLAVNSLLVNHNVVKGFHFSGNLASRLFHILLNSLSFALKLLVQYSRAICDVCQSGNAACHSETTYSICINGEYEIYKKNNDNIQ